MRAAGLWPSATQQRPSPALSGGIRRLFSQAFRVLKSMVLSASRATATARMGTREPKLLATEYLGLIVYHETIIHGDFQCHSGKENKCKWFL